MVYGRLLEAAHISGYTFERLVNELEDLFTGERWQQVGPGYTDVNTFLRSIDLSPFNLGKNRPRLHKRIKELQPKASTRAIGQATGTAQSTVADHLNPPDRNRSPEPVTGASDLQRQDEPDRNRSPELGGRQAAKLAKRRADRITRDRAAEATRIEQARQHTATQDETARVEIRHGDFRDTLADLTDIDAIITDPPYAENTSTYSPTSPLLSEMRAAHSCAVLHA